MRLPRVHQVVHAEWSDEDAPATAHGRTAIYLRRSGLRDAVHSCESPLSRPRERGAEEGRQVRCADDARTERGGAQLAGKVSGGAGGQEHADKEDAAKEQDDNAQWRRRVSGQESVYNTIGIGHCLGRDSTRGTEGESFA